MRNSDIIFRPTVTKVMLENSLSLMWGAHYQYILLTSFLRYVWFKRYHQALGPEHTPGEPCPQEGQPVTSENPQNRALALTGLHQRSNTHISGGLTRHRSEPPVSQPHSSSHTQSVISDWNASLSWTSSHFLHFQALAVAFLLGMIFQM